MMPRRALSAIRDTEDKALTAWLQGQFDEILSLSEAPPRCPHWHSDEAVLDTRAAHPKPVLPVCSVCCCDVHFRRTNGPLSG